MRKQLGLDRAAPIRYFEWLSGAVVLDFGKSLITQNPVAEMIGQRFLNTLKLATYAAVIAVANLMVDMMYSVVDPRIRT